VNPSIATQQQEISAKFKLGMTRLEAADRNQSALEQALLSFHGALEDHIRLALSQKATISAETRAVIHDRSKTQWRELANLAQFHEIITTDNKYFILRMNKKRQAVAHGKACELSKQEVIQYAKLISSIIQRQGTAAPNSPTTSRPYSTHPVAIHKSSRASMYNVAVVIAFIILLAMVIGVVFMLAQPNKGLLAPSAAITSESTCEIKGNISISTGVRYYHLPGMEDYDSTIITLGEGERWFCSEAEAIAQGWKKAPR
jgi:hypothetical protein